MIGERRVDGIRQELIVEKLDQETIHAARKTVALNAESVEEAKQLLDMLGIYP